MGKKAFTLVELMVVIMIIGILAAVSIPRMATATDSAKWSEAKAAMGTIASSLRTYAVENGAYGLYPPSLLELGFKNSDLNGTYFVRSDYSIPAAAFNKNGNPKLTFTIQCDKASLSPARITLDHTGSWVESNP